MPKNQALNVYIMQKIILFILFFFQVLPLGAQPNFPSKKDYRIAVLGCLRQLEPAPALYQYTQLDADLALWIGDNIYSDTKDDPSFIEQNYQKLASLPAFQQLKAEVPFLATWDDHDYGLNNAGGSYPIKAESKQLFRTFWDLSDMIPENQPGIYYSQMKNIEGFELQMIFIDPRYNRDPVRIDGIGDTLGEEQWIWLENELKKPADLRLLISGYQVLLTAESASETWQRFPDAAERLVKTIRESRAEGVVFLTGDQHYGEVLRKKGLLGYDAIELQFAGINQIEDAEYNPLRVAPVIRSKHSVAFIDFKLSADQDNVPHLDFMIYDAIRAEKELHYRVRLDELSYQFEHSGSRLFLDETEYFIAHNYPDLSLRYTMENRAPLASDSEMKTPVSINQSGTLRYALFNEQGIAYSESRHVTFEKLTPMTAVNLDMDLVENGLNFSYAEGEWKSIPDFGNVEISATGVVELPTLESIDTRDDHYAIQWRGYVYVEEEGLYEWQTTSDDGSQLFLHDVLIVDNNGSHSKRMRSGLVALEKGWHPIRIEYFEDYAGQFFELGYKLQSKAHWQKPTPEHFKTRITKGN